ncbi:Eco57I restriction-modification methylase domain-containing protein [Lutibacter citreus]|uniref:Eco57I restriction-modification methylase domain-containing protein n=1 Tax=Lutibacter citreus TaxID=2138210 RepID=UPI000DBE2DA4|nr:Eco57I restriction-modification methylase domain-containing protein [Lutibacter citreus]
MDQKELQKLLNQPYKQENWKEIVQFVFPNVSIFSSQIDIPHNDIRIKRFCQLGNVRLSDGKNLALFELMLNEGINLKKNRVSLNKIVSDHIDQEQIHGILSVFEQGNDDYRFTFSARSSEFDEEESDFVTKKTDTKRFTYLLGKNESCKTPSERFFQLSQKKEEVDISSVQNAFSVEQVSKEFFKKYTEQFKKFWTYIAAKKEYAQLFDHSDKDKKELKIRDFTKKLLGRIVFLHFLQKKGWMGCNPSLKDWQDGDKQFMQHFFEDAENKETFHSHYLYQLFFKALNKKRGNDIFTVDGIFKQLNNTKIPYLNGGLFDTDANISKKIDFPETYFTDLFEFFGQYNFTIDENDPNDHEVGIDPEMLGHIFENLLEDNKDKGAFYTPKAIVQYMCQESLIEYLKTSLNIEETQKEEQAAIEKLVREKLAQEISDFDAVTLIAMALYEVKICDPAIGSGAFPMGMLNEIYQIIEELHIVQPDAVAPIWQISESEWQPHIVKKNIIQHSIYGVDIESGAVDIARLRFWLALIVDETEPLPLPNLDYKIMQGNSLLESFEGIDLSQISNAEAYEGIYETTQIDMFTGEAKKKVQISLHYEDVNALMEQYFNANDPNQKKEIHRKIDKQVINHIKFTLLKHKKELQAISKKLKKDLNFKEGRASTWQQKEKIRTTSKDAKELAKISKTLNELNNKEIALGKLSNSNERPFFLWNLFFKEVFDNGGFDIIIGNPPYLGEKGSKPIFRPIQYSSLGRRFYKGQMDLFYYFFHKSLDILKSKGVLSFITTNYFITADGAIKLRTDIRDRTQIIKMLNFNELRIFETALGQHNLITFLKKDKEQLIKSKIQVSTFKNSFRLSNVIDFLKGKSNNMINFQSYSGSLFESKKNYIRLYNQDINSPKEGVFKKLKKKSKPLGEVFKVNAGIGVTIGKISPKHLKDYPNLNISKGDGVFVVNKIESNSLEEEIVKPFIKNSDIKNYTSNLSDNKLIYLTKSHNLDNFPNVKKHMRKFKPILDDQIISYEEEFPWFALNRPRTREVFEDCDKIIFPYRSKINTFSYSDKAVYGSRDVLFIRKNKSNQSIKSLLTFLNSRLVYFWLYNKGKRKGEVLEMYITPISDIPIQNFDNKINSLFENKANQIINLTNSCDIKKRMNEIDVLYYILYELNYEEVLIIEPEFSERMSKEEYEAFTIE